ncbi:MAG: 3-dehydroquinate synthase family protein [Treponemataceae bacterium]|nr:MAG: 3-dehydroquinate synthase family protein [Treponemataceae bacterium]
MTITYSKTPAPHSTQIDFIADEAEFCASFSERVSSHITQGALIVTDKTIAALPLFSKLTQDVTDGKNTVLVLEAGEKHKTIENVLKIVSAALEAGLGRKSTFVGIGGGVICDMTSFAASIFKRGCIVELIPTTLLAMVDAAIGGKTACDVAHYKNMLGTFYPAQRITFFYGFLQTLDAIEYKSGLAEVIKTALLFDKDLTHFLQKKTIIAHNIPDSASSVLRSLIEPCVRAKAHIVEEDLTEQNIRMFLNFGHTFAHALESVAGLGAVTHGEAVGWGIARALAFSVNEGLCSEEYRAQACSLLLSYGFETEAAHSALKNMDGDARKNALIAVMRHDKKNTTKITDSTIKSLRSADYATR